MGTNFEREEWRQVYETAFNCTIETKLRSFQYQVLNRSLVTNKHLYQWNMSISERCSFCNQDVETIEHLLFQCEKVKQFWKEYSDIFHPHLDLNVIVANQKSVILGATCTQNRNLVNHLILLCKKYVYNTRCKNTQLSVEGVLAMVKNCYSIEYQIACQKSTVQMWNRFNNKWQTLINDHKELII